MYSTARPGSGSGGPRPRPVVFLPGEAQPMNTTPRPTNARAVFLDKDGTLIENVPYNVDPDLVRLTPGAAEGLTTLHTAGYRLVVISNQSGVGLGPSKRTDRKPVKSSRTCLYDLGVARQRHPRRRRQPL